LAQGYLGFLLIVNMEFDYVEAIGLFVLWFVQFALPDTRHLVTGIYFAWCALEILRRITGRRAWSAFTLFPDLWKHGRTGVRVVIAWGSSPRANPRLARETALETEASLRPRPAAALSSSGSSSTACRAEQRPRERGAERDPAEHHERAHQRVPPARTPRSPHTSPAGPPPSAPSRARS
jgi:hypothetical protein